MSDHSRVAADSNHAAKPAHEVPKPSHEHATGQPSPHAVDKLTSAPRMEAAESVDLGDIVPGVGHTEYVFVFNLAETDVARVDVQLTGDPAFHVVSAPTQLQPSSQVFDPSRAVKLELRSDIPGRFRAMLAVTLWWPDGRSEVKRIAVTGAVHAGERTNDERDADAAAAAHRAAEAAAARGRSAQIDRAVEAEYGRHQDRLHDGNTSRADDLTLQLGSQVTSLFEKRELAIDLLNAEIGGYRRQVPQHHQSLLESIAWFALDVAGAAIAGGIAKDLENVIKSVATVTSSTRTVEQFADGDEQIMTISHETIVPFVVGALTDGIKYLVKSGISGIKPGKGSALPDASSSVDAQEGFVFAQKNSLIDSRAGRTVDVQVKLRRSLGPLLRQDPARAFAVLEAVHAGLALEMDAAHDKQLETSRRQWVRLLGQITLGAHELPDGTTATNMHAANQKLENPDDQSSHALRRVDGLLDVEFVGDYNHPERPVQIKTVRLNGVRGKVLDQLKTNSLRDLGLPIRATGFLGDNVTSITVVAHR